MPNRPTRPGKHVARHKAPKTFFRATSAANRRRPVVPALGLRRPAPALRLRRTGGTVVALGAVVLAGAAGNGAALGGSSEDRDRAAAHPAIRLPAAEAATGAAGADAVGAAGARAAEATEVSRSQVRAPLEKAHTESPDDVRRTGGHTARAESADPREIAQEMMADYGWGAGEFECLDELWVSESDWQVRAENPTSGAYGIPQALPPQKMASAGSDWRTSAATQIEWGLWYIDQSYGTPCSAWEFKQANNWY